MKTRNFIALLTFAGLLSASSAQAPEAVEPGPGEVVRHKLPNGKSMEDEILKADYKKSQEEAAQLVKLAQEIQAEFEKNDSHVLSIGLLKKLDEMERTVKRIRARVKK